MTDIKATYQSAVLRCSANECECSVCDFLNGSRDVRDLLEVIRLLDSKLAQSESDTKKVIKLLMAERTRVDRMEFALNAVSEDATDSRGASCGDD